MKKKLTLKKETLRELASKQLSQVVGGEDIGTINLPLDGASNVGTINQVAGADVGTINQLAASNVGTIN